MLGLALMMKIFPKSNKCNDSSKDEKITEKYLGNPVKEVVITVPAYFNDAQRQALKMQVKSQALM